jgi:hypothetical protein
MTPGVDLKGLQMSSDPLPTDDLHRRVAGTVAKLEVGTFSQPLMRPDRGCVSLVSIRSFFLLASDCPRFSQSRLFICLQEVGHHKPSLPPVPKDAVDRAARRVAAEKRKEKKDAKKARAREQTRARDALERLRRRQEREGLPREPPPETPNDDDDDEDDDMVARLGLSPDLKLGQGSSTQPPSGLVPSVSGAGTSGSWSEERGQTEGVLDPSAEVVEVTPGSQAKLPILREPLPVPTAEEGDPRVVVAAPGQSIPWVPRAPKARTVPKPAVGQTSVVPSGIEVRVTSPQARLIMARSGLSILGYLRPGSSFVCPGPDFPFLLSKRRHGSTGLAPWKVLNTAAASAASAAPGLGGQLTPPQDAPKRGAQAAPVAVGLAPEADSSVEADVAPGEAAGAAVALGPPDVLPALAPASAEAVAILAVEPPVTADAEMVEASLPVPSEEGGVEPQPILGGGRLVPARRSPDGRRQSLWFWTSGASDPLFVLDDEREEQSWDELHECAETTVGSLRSTLEVLRRGVPKILQVMSSSIPFA